MYGGGYYVLENVLIQNKENYNNVTFGEPRVKADDSWSLFGGSSTLTSSAISKSGRAGGGTGMNSEVIGVRPGAS